MTEPLPLSLLNDFRYGPRRAALKRVEEMFGVPGPRGAIFDADSKRRREVEFTAELRSLTEQATDPTHLIAPPHPSGSAPRPCRVALQAPKSG